MFKGKIEIFIHLVLWLFLLSSINIEWTSSWFDPSIRPNNPAPLSLFMFAFYFYVNAFWLIPKYFSIESWKKYVFYGFLLFILPEVIRIVIYKLLVRDIGIESELFSRDSFLFGMPSAFFFGLNTSFIYRLTKDWFKNKKKIQELNEASQEKKNAVPYKNVNLLTDQETAIIHREILDQLDNNEIYLNPELTLRDLAETIGSTEKKVSYFLNQNLDSSYAELINKYRVEKFKIEVADPKNTSLSVVGIALNCGFPSKSSFYRAFKSQVSMTPSEYIKKIVKPQ